MKSIFFRAACAALFFAGSAQAAGTWERHTAPLSPQQVIVGDEQKTVNPMCALGQPYSFYLKPGQENKLLVYFNGGGSCWDNNTCVGSLSSSRPVYVPSTNTQNNPALMGGVLDGNNPNNPYANWSMLFISYCTGDVHTGSADHTYTNPLPAGPKNPLPPLLTIHHRGFDNFLYAMTWLKDNHPEIEPDSILATGSSAGSYGAALNFPWLKKIYPDADKTLLFGDGGAGVFVGANGFVNAVFGTPSNWAIHDNLHPVLSALPAQFVNQPAKILPVTYKQLGTAYPKSKFAQYTTAYDAVQTFFWDIMLNSDSPWLWGAGLGNPLFISQWNGEMNAITGELTASLPKNYRAYIGPGCNHTVLRFNDDFYNSTLKSSSTGQTISFVNWFKALTQATNTANTSWQNLSCTPGVDCGEANLTPQGITACLSRTFNTP